MPAKIIETKKPVESKPNYNPTAYTIKTDTKPATRDKNDDDSDEDL
jgi:hypothetical protein